MIWGESTSMSMSSGFLWIVGGAVGTGRSRGT